VAQGEHVARGSMAIDKDEVGQESESSRLTPVKFAWGTVIVFVITLSLAFVFGIWTHYIVEFFMRGWELIR
jgi:hypothetical protein